MEIPKTALILCGGKGTRLRPLTYEIPKVLIPIKGKPILEYNIESMKKYGIENIILATGYLGKMIRDYFGDGNGFGVNIKYSEEKSPLGTGGALRMARDLLKETVIMMNGDELKDIDLRGMFSVHRGSNALITIALTEVEDPSSFGVARLEGNRILEFVEKPKKEEAPSSFINAGLYIIDPSVIDLIPEGEVSIERQVFPLVAGKGRLFGFPFRGKWFPTDDAERLEKAKSGWE
jgi:NDP-sugar pyrophosphorylase family protein